ncbi:hypothetical protein PMAYCL1PPCAC_25530, partial [Pristionchus mayeri]
TITKEELINFFEKKIAPGASERRKLSIYIHSKEDNVEDVVRLRNRGARNKTGMRTEIDNVDSWRIPLGYFGGPLPAIDL